MHSLTKWQNGRRGRGGRRQWRLISRRARSPAAVPLLVVACNNQRGTAARSARFGGWEHGQKVCCTIQGGGLGWVALSYGLQGGGCTARLPPRPLARLLTAASRQLQEMLWARSAHSAASLPLLLVLHQLRRQLQRLAVCRLLLLLLVAFRFAAQHLGNQRGGQNDGGARKAFRPQALAQHHPSKGCGRGGREGWGGGVIGLQQSRFGVAWRQSRPDGRRQTQLGCKVRPQRRHSTHAQVD